MSCHVDFGKIQKKNLDPKPNRVIGDVFLVRIEDKPFSMPS